MNSREALTQQLFDAIECGAFNSVVLLIDKGADLAQKNKLGQTPIHYAATLGRWDCVESIARIRKTTPHDDYGYGKVIHHMHKFANIYPSLLKLLIAQGASTSVVLPYLEDKNIEFKKQIFNAIEENRPELVRQLAKKEDADLAVQNDDGLTPIEFAAQEKRWSCVKAIIQAKKIDAYDDYHYTNVFLLVIRQYTRAIVRGVQLDKQEIIDLFCLSGGIDQKRLRTCMYYAILNDDKDVVHYFLKHKLVDVTQKYKHDHTILEIALTVKSWACVELLIYLGGYKGDFYKNKITNEDIINAFNDKQDKLVNSLIALRTLNATDHNGNTLLHVAIRQDNEELLKELLKRGASITSQDRNGKNAVELAAELGKWEYVTLLLPDTTQLLKFISSSNILNTIKTNQSQVSLNKYLVDRLYQAFLLNEIAPAELSAAYQYIYAFQQAIFECNAKSMNDAKDASGLDYVFVDTKTLARHLHATDLYCNLANTQIPAVNDITGWLKYRNELHQYAARVHNELVCLAEEIEGKTWKYGIGPNVLGLRPTSVKNMLTELKAIKSVKDLNIPSSHQIIFKVYNNVIKTLKNTKQDAGSNRYPETQNYYDEKLQRLESIRFGESSCMQTEKSTTSTTSLLTSLLTTTMTTEVQATNRQDPVASLQPVYNHHHASFHRPLAARRDKTECEVSRAIRSENEYNVDEAIRRLPDHLKPFAPDILDEESNNSEIIPCIVEGLVHTLRK